MSNPDGDVLLTHARVYPRGTDVRAEFWEHPKPAPRRPRTAERLAGAKSHVRTLGTPSQAE